MVENLNSRLRSYFFLRRHLGNDYLSLLQFFLNHRRYVRSEHSDRFYHSPTELLTGESHPHWLELLGYTLFPLTGRSNPPEAHLRRKARSGSALLPETSPF